MVAGSLKHLVSVEERVEAARAVAALPGGGAALADAEVKSFIDAVGAERGVNEFVAAAVDLLPPAGDRATVPLLDLLAEMIGPDARRMLARLCAGLDDARLAALCEDGRWKVRQAAVDALALRDPAASRPVLLARLEDKELAVRLGAGEALARQKAPEAFAVLLELSGNEEPETRGSAAYALGLLGSAEARDGVRRLLLADVNPEVRVRAIDGVVEGAAPEGAALLAEVFSKEQDVRVRAAAANGLVRLETPALVDQMMTRLQETRGADAERVALVNVLARFRSDRPVPLLRAVLNGDDELSREAAALGLSRRWDDAALIPLIRMLKAGHNTRAAIRHLQLLTSQAFESESYAEQATNYQGWATAHGTGNARAWFKEALELRGYDVRPVAGWLGGASLTPPPDDCVPTLLKALRDKEWYIQRNASFLLNLRIGEKAPEEIGYATAEGDAEGIIRAYHDWWDAYVKAREAREKE
jgi:HEAT repeat protein